MNVTFPVDFGTRGFGVLGAIPRTDVDYCDGPVTYGVPAVVPDRYTTRWVGWQAPDGVRFKKLLPGFTPDTSGALSVLLAGATRSWVSMCFDKDGFEVFGTDDPLTPGNCQLHKIEIGVPTDYIFPGKTPVLFCTSILVSESINQEVVVFYLKAAGDTIYLRLEREVFANEHVFATLTVPLDRLTKIDRIDKRMVIWGVSKTTTGRPGVLYSAVQSQEYQPFPPTGLTDHAVVAIGFTGAYLSLIVSAGVQTDGATADATLSGVYFATIVDVGPLTPEAVTGDVSLSGVYFLAMVDVGPLTPEAATGDVSLSGVYEDVIRSTGPLSDAATADVGFHGVYQAA